MKELGLIFYCIILMLICQLLITLAAHAEGENSDNSSASATPTLTDNQKTAIVSHCTAIKDSLKLVQKDDSHARVYLGGYYEKIISKYVVPLNVRLVENSLSTSDLVENQNDLTKAKATFVSDFIDYQRELETLINIDCQSQPENFYTQLVKVRTKRSTVASDIDKTRQLVSAHATAVSALKEKI